jgi:C-terminal processing protease CtpA/Prc
MKNKPFINPLLLALFLCFPLFVYGQIRVDEVVGKSDPSVNRSRGIKMLKQIKEVIETYYYDKNYRGIDIDQKFKEAAEKIKSLETNARIFRVIAGVLLEFNDSHTRFYPPGRSDRVEYGFSMQMIGDKGFIVDVIKGSDAEKQGMKVGDRLLKIGQYDITRDSLWALNYFIYQLEPMPLLPVTFVDSRGAEKTVGITASFKSFEQRKKEAEARRKDAKENPVKCSKISPALTACKLRSFAVEKKYIDEMMKQAVTGSKFILDLRGNRGGYVKMEEYLTGHFFDHEVKIADMVTRTKTKTSESKPVKDRQFKGELVVLIDSDSASASEVFARLIQLEKRGKIVGDVSAGAVMTSYSLGMAIDRGVPGYETITPFGLNVTVADLIMSDGNRLENSGVIPDHPVGPTAYALANKSDPVLSFAVKLLGENLTAEEAGKLGFLFKKTEDSSDDGDDEKDNDSDKQ